MRITSGRFCATRSWPNGCGMPPPFVAARPARVPFVAGIPVAANPTTIAAAVADLAP
jgi:hypothetical protein